MRIHVVSLPHTETTREYVWCAYTEKIRKFCNMMMDEGHEVYLYAGEASEAKAVETVIITPRDWQEQHFGHYDWSVDVFGGWDPSDPWWQEMNAFAAREINKRSQPGDYLGIIAGRCQDQLIQLCPNLTPVEWGIGYEGILPNTYRVFESYAWMHKLSDANGRFYDTVIPNSFELEDFTFGPVKDDYFLFLGRHIERKGLAVVEEIAKHHRVVTAGQGTHRVKGAEYLGVVKGEEKKELLSKATALLAPTTYIEPFGGVTVEAMLSGTPVITTDWGAFTETVEPGQGFRCRLLAEFLHAAERCTYMDTVNYQSIRLRALKYTTEEIAPRYSYYFRQLDTLKGKGWYDEDFIEKIGGSRP